MRISDEGIGFIALEEGRRSKMYHDIAGYPTIGIGHLLTAEEMDSGRIMVPIPFDDGLTEDQIETIFRHDVRKATQAIRTHVNVPLNQNQYDALVSFIYNVGTGAFSRSTLLKKLNEGRYSEVPKQLKRWDKAGGRKIPGLTRRRKREAKLWNSEV